MAGRYEIREIILLKEEDAEGPCWQAHGSFEQGQRPTVVVPTGGAVDLPGGLPLEVRPAISRDGRSGALSISLEITGVAGETYRWSEQNPGGKPGFEVRDEEGKLVHSQSFEYG